MTGPELDSAPDRAAADRRGQAAPRRAVVASLSRLHDDPRVRRQIRTLFDHGWAVTSIGYGRPPFPDIGELRHVEIPERDFDARPLHRLARVAGLVGTRVSPALAQRIWAAQPRHRALAAALSGIEDADVVVANDYVALPAAIALARRSRAALVYDSHEFAAGERAEEARWRLLYPPYIRAIERAALAEGAVLVTVSEGIAQRVAAIYQIPAPTVVRNLPFFSAAPERPVSDAPLLHYHGIVAPGRGLESLIDSVPSWRTRFRLRIRGPGAPDYVRGLADRAARAGVAARIAIEPAVPAETLIETARDADLGVHMLPGFSEQNRYALPNKLFEYLMAGLGVLVSDLPAMRAIVTERGVGALIAGEDPGAIAAVVNALTDEHIQAFRVAAREAARELCWEREQHRFLAVCEAAWASRSGSGGRRA